MLFLNKNETFIIINMKQSQLLSGKISGSVKKKLLLMGVLNITPDSFSDGGKYFRIEDAVNHARELIKQGVDIIDIGGESTRPDAKPISEEEELKRVIPVICELKKKRPEIFISIDTYKANVAQLALNAGARMINDVSGLTMDPNMVRVAANANCPIVIMHNRGIPATKPVASCQLQVTGENLKLETCNLKLIKEIYEWLQKQTNFAIANGVKQEMIIIDPGIGFGKTPEEDYEIIKNLKEFKSLGFPILVGPSRKSFIRKLFGDDNFEAKSKEMIDLAIKNGADIVRVHL